MGLGTPRRSTPTARSSLGPTEASSASAMGPPRWGSSASRATFPKLSTTTWPYSAGTRAPAPKRRSTRWTNSSPHSPLTVWAPRAPCSTYRSSIGSTANTSRHKTPPLSWSNSAGSSTRRASVATRAQGASGSSPSTWSGSRCSSLTRHRGSSARCSSTHSMTPSHLGRRVSCWRTALWMWRELLLRHTTVGRCRLAMAETGLSSRVRGRGG
mmetsp:Transcript_52964/g.133332  ORF Transcript_52964/g.133332 Transcript_52964/m.133332 type:complete len:212 (+) Transcript_52964:331-966(+)